MVDTRVSAAVEAGSNNAALIIAIESSEASAGQRIYVYGEEFNGFGKNRFSAGLPGIDIAAITRMLNLGGAKHSAFRGKGNRFSRIAWLVQAGYSAALSQAFEPPPSGVVFHWTANDLRKYIQKWVSRLDKAGNYNNTAARGLLTKKEVAQSDALGMFREVASTTRLTSYYTYTSDTAVTVSHDVQKKQLKDLADKEEMQSGSVHFDL